MARGHDGASRLGLARGPQWGTEESRAQAAGKKQGRTGRAAGALGHTMPGHPATRIPSAQCTRAAQAATQCSAAQRDAVRHGAHP